MSNVRAIYPLHGIEDSKMYKHVMLTFITPLGPHKYMSIPVLRPVTPENIKGARQLVERRCMRSKDERAT